MAEAKQKVEVQMVAMEDGRTVSFAGKKKMLKEVVVGENSVQIRFDFRNGMSRLFTPRGDMALQFIGHGASQKIGDEAAGEESVDDMVVCIDDVIGRLNNGEWTSRRAAGDSFSGASIVIKAICEVTGKSVEDTKAFLQRKLDEAAAKGEKLSRSDLYASFRRPTSKTGVVIARLEAEKAAKSGTSVNSDDMLDELEAA